MTGTMSDNPTRYFCTAFDRHFLPRALALYSSLQAHCRDFKLIAYCHDVESFSYFSEHPRSQIIPIAVSEIEAGDGKLIEAKKNRSLIEYYFTCTPVICLYSLNKFPDIDLITYLDSDLYFFSDPQPIFNIISTNSIGIIEHNFARGARRYSKYGKYNVAWLTFRRNNDGLACLSWWRDRCLEWCYDRLEDGKFADQKYLDDWPERFRNVVTIKLKGANLAGWNINNYSIRNSNGQVLIDDEQLIFFHYAGFKEVTSWLFKTGFGGYFVYPSRIIRKDIFEPYIKELKRSSCDRPVGKRIRKIDFHMVGIKQLTRNAFRLIRGIFFRDYLFYFRGKVW